MQRVNKKDYILFQWPGTDSIESIYPRCVVFHRLFNILNFEFTVRDLDLAQFDNENYNSKIKDVLKLFPILKYKGQKYSTTNEIISFLLGHFENTKIIDDIKKYGMAYNVIVSEWANQVFLYSLLYARWIREKNYRNFIQSVNWGTVPSSRQSFEDRQNLLRELVVKHIKTTPTGVLKYDDFYTTLISQLISLEKLLQHQV